MHKKQLLKLVLTVLVSMGFIELRHIIPTEKNIQPVSVSEKSTIHSQYAGDETLSIKSLSQPDIEGLRQGTGTPLGGLAKLAELNGYPGPRHVLDAINAGELVATSEQKAAIQTLYDEMQPQAVDLGLKLIAIESDLNDAFATNSISEESLQNKLEESAGVYTQLRYTHLKYHLAMMDILTPDQITKYNSLRGYTSDPCKNIPEGHDPALWKMHNNCG